MSNIPDYVTVGVPCGPSHWEHELFPGEVFILSYAVMNWNTGVGGSSIEEVI